MPRRASSAITGRCTVLHDLVDRRPRPAPAPARCSPCRRCWGRDRRPARACSRAPAPAAAPCSPSHSASSDTSGPSSRCSISTRAPAPPKRRSIRQACTARSASATRLAHEHALAGGQAVGLDHHVAVGLGDGELGGGRACRRSRTRRWARRRRPSPPWRTPSSPRSGGRRGGAEAGDAGRLPAGRPARPPAAPRGRSRPGRRAARRPARSAPRRSSDGRRRGRCASAGDAGVAGRGVQLAQAGRAGRPQASACSRPPDPTRRTRIAAGRVYYRERRSTR